MAPIRFKFDERKAADAAAFLLYLHGGEMNHMRLIKLLYAAERASLEHFNRPIVGDKYVSMDHGPVVSRLYNLMKEQDEFPAWSVLIERTEKPKNTLKLLTDEPHSGSLSDADIEMLKEVSDRYHGLDQFQIAEKMHQEFQEWEDPAGSSTEIPVERILAAIRKSPEDIARVKRIAEEKQYFENLFGV